MHKCLPLLLLISALLITGCQKDVREVRRTEKGKYSVGTDGYAVKSGSHLEVQSGRYAPQAGGYSPQAGKYAPQTGSYGAGGVTQSSPSAPRQQPAALHTRPRTISGG